MGPDLDETLEIFGQQTVGVTTPFVFCYSLPDTVDFPAIISTLESGLRRLTDGFPWVAGKVINQGKTEVNSGVFKIKHGWDTPRLFVKDHRDNVRAPTMQSLSEARFPVSMLPESMFSPINVLPTDPDQDRSPVFVVQINRIEGGLLLAIIGNHQALDGTGQEQLSYLLNKACNGLPFSEDELRIGNLSRSTIVMPLDDSWQPSPNSRYLKVQQKVATVDELPPTNPRWVTISFSGEALSMLKAKANNEIQSGFSSTDDALTALIWQAISRARLGRLPASKESTLGRAINPRRYLGIPATYPGYITNMAYTSQKLGDLNTLSLGDIASQLRSAVDPQTSGLDRTTREFATLLHRAENKDSVSVHEGFDLDADLMLSSWANMRCYDFCFGMRLGSPVAFRRTQMDPFTSLIYLLPKRKDGEIVVVLGAMEEDLTRLRADEHFNRFGQFLD
ncbi:hypothetical protein NliqN6_0859 [Naganishia liquefaciens]|uniref:Trichothecene 3-O-acetyltransferase-like N-terminal domain-containing protein n=1 Tax=Naganishia liquefaciens TaxID=104408 RepID=A0A8H3TNS8_9TREE|nr:hypothetical protein NliqN6_0859 [Naganishia liquefaciens]